MRKPFFLILVSLFLPVLFLPVLCFSQIYLSGAQSDTLDAGEYIVEDDIWVESHTLWYLRPGVVLRFYEGVRCTNHGALYAMGAEGDSIRFESFEEGIPWRGINLETTNYRAKLNYIVVTGSDDSGISVSPMSTMTLRHSRISHNTVEGDRGAGIHTNTLGSDSILYSSISNNSGIGLYSEFDANIVNHCLFTNNTEYGIFADDAFLKISNSKFTRNENSAIKEWSSGIEIDSCEFSYNSAIVGAALYSTGAVQINRTLFNSNSARNNGGAIYSGSPFFPVNITNSIFFNNTADSGSVYFGYPTFIINTIIFQNNGNEAIYTRDGLLGSYNSLYFENGNNVTFAEDSNYSENFGHLDTENANGDECDIFENIFLNPQLIDPSNNNFHPLEISPCIDAGTTEAGLIDSLSDPDGGLVDIGIHYFNQNTVLTPAQVSNPSSIQLNSVYPNPFNSQITLSVEIPKSQPYTLTVHDILGRQISREPFALSPGNHQLAWVASENMAAGVYYLTLRSVQYSQSVRIFYVK